VEETKKVTGDKIELVCGGFHLIPFDKTKIEEIARYLKDDLGVRRVAPAHCTGHLAFKTLNDLYGEAYIYAGLGETIRF
jgi:7,8-dihydropterin-6-yl-methyl-4-(beta-D-ribofuranosyl)aminobenzene 5'-phosphate synthase